MKCCYSHFTHEKNEAQSSQITCPNSKAIKWRSWDSNAHLIQWVRAHTREPNAHYKGMGIRVTADFCVALEYVFLTTMSNLLLVFLL